MNMTELLSWLQATVLAQAVSKSNFLVGAGLQILHIFGLLLLFGAVSLVSLRLLGLVLVQQPIVLVSRAATRYVWIGIAMASVSGALMFITTPIRYASNRPFLAKMALLVVALLVQRLLFQRVAARDSPDAGVARVTVFATVALWTGVTWAGRFVGFV